MNPWHDVEPGKRAPEIVDCIIEVPRGSRNKYELDKKTGLLRLDRVLYSAVFYPANYGFIPRTYCDDRDPLDILVLGQEPVVPMCIVTARPIGMMQMVDQNEEDDKIIAIHENDPAVAHFRDISQLPEHTLNELQRFFEDYKILEHKRVRIERFFGRVDAQNIIAKSLRLYDDSFNPDGSKRADAPTLQSELRNRGTSSAPSRAVRIEHARRESERLSSLDRNRDEHEPYGVNGNISNDGSMLDTSGMARDYIQNAPPEPLSASASSAKIEPIQFDFQTLDAHAPRVGAHQDSIISSVDAAEESPCAEKLGIDTTDSALDNTAEPTDEAVDDSKETVTDTLPGQ
jgi:inorganic pyrophosphatase